jgi:hypothetical protein
MLARLYWEMLRYHRQQARRIEQAIERAAPCPGEPLSRQPATRGESTGC